MTDGAFCIREYLASLCGLEGTRMRRFVREGKGHAGLELGREKLRNVINDGGRSLHDTGL